MEQAQAKAQERTVQPFSVPALEVQERQQEGKDAAQTLSLIPSVLTLTTAGMHDTTKAAQLLNNILNVYGKGLKGPADATDVLAKAANATQFSLDDLNVMLRQVGSTTTAYGIDLEKTAGLGNLFRTTMKTQGQSGTMLRNVMLSLQVPSRKMMDVLAGVHMKMRDLDPRRVGFDKFMKNMERIFSDQGRSAAAFGKVTGAALTTVLTSGKGAAAGMREYAEGFKSASNAQEIAALKMLTVDAQLRRMRSAVQNVGIAFWDHFEKPVALVLRKVVNVLTNLTPVFKGLFGSIAKDVMSFGEKVFGGLGGWATMFTNLSQEKTAETRQVIGSTLKQVAVALAIWKAEVKLFLSGFINGFSSSWDRVGPILKKLAGAVEWVLDKLSILTGRAATGGSEAERFGASIGSATAAVIAMSASLFLLTVPMFLIGNILKPVVWVFKHWAAIVAVLTTISSSLASVWAGLHFAAMMLGISFGSFLAIAVGAVAIIVLGIVYWKEWTGWIKEAGSWLDAVLVSLGIVAVSVGILFSPVIGIFIGVAAAILLIIRHWDWLVEKVKSGAKWVGGLFGMKFDTEVKPADELMSLPASSLVSQAPAGFGMMSVAGPGTATGMSLPPPTAGGGSLMTSLMGGQSADMASLMGTLGARMSAPEAMLAMGGGGGDVNQSFAAGSLVVQAGSGDPNEIAEKMHDALVRVAHEKKRQGKKSL